MLSVQQRRHTRIPDGRSCRRSRRRVRPRVPRSLLCRCPSNLPPVCRQLQDGSGGTQTHAAASSHMPASHPLEFDSHLCSVKARAPPNVRAAWQTNARRAIRAPISSRQSWRPDARRRLSMARSSTMVRVSPSVRAASSPTSHGTIIRRPPRPASRATRHALHVSAASQPSASTQHLRRPSSILTALRERCARVGRPSAG